MVTRLHLDPLGRQGYTYRKGGQMVKGVIDFSDMWKQYRTWKEKAAKDRDARIAEVRAAVATMQGEAAELSDEALEAAGGGLANRLSVIDADYADQMKKIQASEAYNVLNGLYQWERQQAIKTTPHYFRRTADMTQREKRRFGRLNRGDAFDPHFGKVPDNRGDAYDPMRGQAIDNRGGAWDPNLADNPDVVTKHTSVDTFDYQTYGKTFDSWGAVKFGSLETTDAQTSK